MPDNWVFATGRRKTSVARVMIRKGNGSILINEVSPDDYFPSKNQVAVIHQPLQVSANTGKWDLKVTVKGGGYNGQAGAIRHAIARALVEVDPDSKNAISKSGYLTRDARMVERKKSGQPKARKRFQFSKR
ncbi:MAG: 30S ribosomal protein S9 [Spirochaetes bacterium]|nr:30S ribosomal protein S9 [Spirochaetota bacterium]